MDPDNAREINGAINRAFDKKRNGAAAVARILVLVDDDPDQQAIAQVLAGDGHEVDLVVLATHRPGSPRVKVIMLVDEGEPQSNIVAAKTFGADRVLVTPVDTRDLLACVWEVVGES